MRKILLTALTLMAAACIGPSGSHREGYQAPTSPPIPPTYNLFGRVLEISNGAPIPGASVDIGSIAVVSNVDGNYNLAGLRANAIDVVVTAAAYDTLRQRIAFPTAGGTYQWTFRLRRTAPTIVVAP